jgi:hypothetical protein
MMRAYNVTKNSWLAAELGLAHTFFSRIRGLLGRSGLTPSEGLWIKPCNSIHMVGMRFPIDAVFLNRQSRVVKTVEHLRPGRLVFPVMTADSVIELPAGTIAGTGTAVGDEISIIESLNHQIIDSLDQSSMNQSSMNQ